MLIYWEESHPELCAHIRVELPLYGRAIFVADVAEFRRQCNETQQQIQCDVPRRCIIQTLILPTGLGLLCVCHFAQR